MCGHFGLHHPVGALTITELNCFYNMMLAGVVRGMDGTGIVAVDSDGAGLRAVKTAGGPWQLFGSNVWKAFKDSMDKTAATLIGHHRAATKGGVTGKNAHPFHHKHITMAHNGTLTNTIPVEFSVDSDWIASEFADKGLDVFKDVHGAYVCVWWDDKTKTVNFFANKERPFSVVEYDKTLFWASEEEMLLWVLGRQMKPFDPKKLTIYDIEEDTHYYVDPKSSILIKGEKVVKNPKPNTTYYRTDTNYTSAFYPSNKETKSVAPYRSKKGKNKKKSINDDMFCSFFLIEEVALTGGFYQYRGITDRNEFMSLKTSFKILNWNTDQFEGMLKPGARIKVGDGGESSIEYEIEPDTFWAVDEEDAPNTPESQLELADGTLVGKYEFASLSVDPCAACDFPIPIGDVSDYLPVVVGTNRRIHGLICRSCQEAFAEQVENA